ncbi:MAG: sigma 54-interacting transcriptional regulator [Pseudomonadota bacterium]
MENKVIEWNKIEKLLEINSKINSQLDKEKLLGLIMDSAIAISGAERGFLILLDEEKNLQIPIARNIERHNLKKEAENVSMSIINKVIARGEPILSSDAVSDARFDNAKSIFNLKIRSILCFPIKADENIIGAIYLDNRFDRGVFTTDDELLTEAFCNQAAIAIENAKLFEENLQKQSMLETQKGQIEELNKKLKMKVAKQEVELMEVKEELEVHRTKDSLKYDYKNIIGQSPKMMEVLSLVDKITESDLPILVNGESGTGKELVARAIHYNGPRKTKAFVTENCAALSETLLESELFGHKKGAFTGASSDKKGLFEIADQGTIFLDEIGDMSLNMQKKLLRVLQEGEIRKIGDDRIIKVNARLVSATHRDLTKLVSTGQFREDLFYRINVVKIELPPLRERPDDVPILIKYFVEKFCETKDIPTIEISQEVYAILKSYPWPGNIRELENEINRLITMSDKEYIGIELVKDDIRFQKDDIIHEPIYNEVETEHDVKQVNKTPQNSEKARILESLEKNNWNKSKTAEELDISRPTLDVRIRKHNISR